MPLDFPGPLDIDRLCRLIGFLGVLLYITGFLLLSTGRVDSARPGYFALIFVAASCVLISLCVDFNISAALIQLFYIAMSGSAMALRLRKRRRTNFYGPRPMG